MKKSEYVARQAGKLYSTTSYHFWFLTLFSGKSAFLAILFRLLNITNGQVTIDDLDISTIPRHIIRRSLIALPQDSFLVVGSVRFHMSLGRDVQSTSSEVSDKELIEALMKVQLWDTVSQRGGLNPETSSLSLSHGQKQLLCIARALFMSTDQEGKNCR